MNNNGDSRVKQRLERIPGMKFFLLLFSVTHGKRQQQQQRCSCVSSPALVSPLWLATLSRGPGSRIPAATALRKEKKKKPLFAWITFALASKTLHSLERRKKKNCSLALTLTSQARSQLKRIPTNNRRRWGKNKGGGFLVTPSLSFSLAIFSLLWRSLVLWVVRGLTLKMCLVLVVKATRLMPRELSWRRGISFRIVSAHALLELLHIWD